MKHKLILVYSTYRCGSTAYCQTLAKKYNYINQDEYFHWCNKDKHWDIENDSIIKIMPDHDVDIDLVNVERRILLLRKDIYKQITSLYIAHITKHWHNYTSTKAIPWDMQELINQCNYILNLNKIISKYNITFDETVYYEDLDLSTATNNINVKPVNYVEILNAVTEYVNKVSKHGA